MIQDILETLQESFDGAFTRLARELQKIRTGRANPALLDEIRVEYYGAPSPLSQVASVKVPEPRLITIQPWDKTLLPAIEKAIHASDLGLTPNNDGTLIRLSIPPLTGERRAEFAKGARKHGEDAKIAVRAGRKDANDLLKALQKDGDISEDELHRHTATVQERTDKAVARIDEMVAKKEKEIMEV
jgi:ribosome recycling factor